MIAGVAVGAPSSLEDGSGGGVGGAVPALNELFDVILHADAATVREYILQAGCDVDLQNDKGDTALLLAARRGDLEVVEALLDTAPGVPQASVHTRNNKGSNALIAAAMKGHTDICRLLIARGADVNQSTDSHDTALSLAIWQNHTDVCLLLMSAGAMVDNVDKFGDCLALGTMVARADGSAVAVEDVRVGDSLLGPHARPVRVQAVDALKSSDKLIRIDTAQAADAYAVTPNHTLVMTWNANPRVQMRRLRRLDPLTLGDDNDECELRAVWYEPVTYKARKKTWRCAPIDPENATSVSASAASAASFSSIPAVAAFSGESDDDSECESEEIEFDGCDSDFSDASEAASISDNDDNDDDDTPLIRGQTCSELKSFAKDWLRHARRSKRVRMLRAGECVEIKAQALYDARDSLIAPSKRTKQQKMSGRRVSMPSRPISSTDAAASAAAALSFNACVPPVEASSASVLYTLHHPFEEQLLSSTRSSSFHNMDALWNLCGLDAHQQQQCDTRISELRPLDESTGARFSSLAEYDAFCLASMRTSLENGARRIVAFGSLTRRRWHQSLASIPGVSAVQLSFDSMRFLFHGEEVLVYGAPHPSSNHRTASSRLVSAIASAHDLISSHHLATLSSRISDEAFGRVHITSVEELRFEVPVPTVDLQVEGSIYALASGLLTHNSMLLDASKHGNTAVMRMLLEKQSVPLDHCNKKGNSALITAAWKGELEALRLLLDRGADPCIANKTGATALIMACQHNNRACAKLLIERDSSPINAVDETGRSAFAYLALYAPPQQQASQPPPPPSATPSADDPYWEGMMMLLDRHVRLDSPSNMGNLLLCRAANINHHVLAAALLREGADINFCDPVNKSRPALLAHLQGAPDLECTRFLLEQHAQVDYQDADGHSGLMFAVKHNDPDILEFLLESGASILLENKAGETASSMCMQIVHAMQTNFVQLQQQQQMAVSPSGGGGVSPDLSTALSAASVSLDRAQRCLGLLMDRSAREMGSGALLLQAAQHGDLDKLEQYVLAGVQPQLAAAGGEAQPHAQAQPSSSSSSPAAAAAPATTAATAATEKIDVNFSDKTGRSALMLAAKANHTACVKFLLQQGALLNLRDKDGLTALTLAIRSGARECAELLAETIQSHTLSRYGGGFHFPGPGGGIGPGPGPGVGTGPGVGIGAGPAGFPTQFAPPSGFSITGGMPPFGGVGGIGGDFSDGLGSMSLEDDSAFASGGGVGGVVGASGGGGGATNSQIFGLRSPPQQMAREEFDASTNFLRAVAQQLTRYLAGGGAVAVRENIAQQHQQQLAQQQQQAQQAAHAHAAAKKAAMAAAAAAAAQAQAQAQQASDGSHVHGGGFRPNPLQLSSPAASLPRSTSYFSSFPSPTSSSAASSQPQSSSLMGRSLSSQQQQQQMDPLLPSATAGLVPASTSPSRSAMAAAASLAAAAMAPPSSSSSSSSSAAPQHAMPPPPSFIPTPSTVFRPLPRSSSESLSNVSSYPPSMSSSAVITAAPSPSHAVTAAQLLAHASSAFTIETRGGASIIGAGGGASGFEPYNGASFPQMSPTSSASAIGATAGSSNLAFFPLTQPPPPPSP